MSDDNHDNHPNQSFHPPEVITMINDKALIECPHCRHRDWVKIPGMNHTAGVRVLACQALGALYLTKGDGVPE